MTENDIAILIPARMGSTRFPNKPMTELGGLTLIARVIERCKETKLPVFVLTDDISIATEAVYYGAMPIMESDIPTDKPQNGTERCAYTVMYSEYLKPYNYFINVQGDMPDVTYEMIDALIDQEPIYNGNRRDVSTLYTDMAKDLQKDPNTVKCVVGKERIHWFGRGLRYGYHHLGVYAYTRKALETYSVLLSGRGEIAENLEQLRWLENDYEIYGVYINDFNGIEINTPEDAKLWNTINEKN